MSSATTPSKHQHQHRQSEMAASQPPSQPPAAPMSPPSKRSDLKSWWKKFQVQSNRHHETRVEPRPQGIFGVPLRQSITYANVAISLVDENGQSYIYGYVPIVVAKCGVFLKEKATTVEGIFRLNGSEKRIKELKIQFDSPDRYGKGLVWDGYTVHDAANVLRRYLNDLPEPVVPLDLYEHFRGPLRGHTKQAVGDTEGTQLLENFDQYDAVKKYQDLIKELPPLNRQLLLYILDLLAVFAAKSDENRMTAQNLAAIFQPGMLSHPHHAMSPEEYRLNQCVIIFLIEHQDHFLIGMQGTGTDEQTKQEIEQGTPRLMAPSTPSRQTGVVRTSSNASAGAESVTRDGTIRRNRSTSSRHSRHSRYSNGASTPNSPAISTPGSGLARSNTVPSKKSLLQNGRFSSRHAPVVAVAPGTPAPSVNNANATPAVTEQISVVPIHRTPAVPNMIPVMPTSVVTAQSSGHHGAARSQERLLGPHSGNVTPSKERNLQSLFQRSPNSDGEKRQPNKLRKKRLPDSSNASAQSSTASLAHSVVGASATEAGDHNDKTSHLDHALLDNVASVETPSEPTPRASRVPPAGPFSSNADHGIESLRPKPSEPVSLHSSFNDNSDPEQLDETVHTSSEALEKDKKRPWRMSRRKEDVMGPPPTLGNNSHAEMSSSTVGSAQRPRKSWTGDSAEHVAGFMDSDARYREKDDNKGPLGWFKTKYRGAKENVDKRAKSPPEHIHGLLPTRNKSSELRRSVDEKKQGVGQSCIQDSGEPNPLSSYHDLPLSHSPPPMRESHDDKPPNL